jgi:hypothetical protein
MDLGRHEPGHTADPAHLKQFLKSCADAGQGIAIANWQNAPVGQVV